MPHPITYTDTYNSTSPSHEGSRRGLVHLPECHSSNDVLASCIVKWIGCHAVINRHWFLEPYDALWCNTHQRIIIPPSIMVESGPERDAILIIPRTPHRPQGGEKQDMWPTLRITVQYRRGNAPVTISIVFTTCPLPPPCGKGSPLRA